MSLLLVHALGLVIPVVSLGDHPQVLLVHASDLLLVQHGHFLILAPLGLLFPEIDSLMNLMMSLSLVQSDLYGIDSLTSLMRNLSLLSNPQFLSARCVLPQSSHRATCHLLAQIHE
jgi:hypothetical protein